MGRSLSGRLLILTILTVMVVEVVIFAPSVARFRVDFLEERLRLAELAALAILASPGGRLDPRLEERLLQRAGAESVTLHRDGETALELMRPEPGMVKATFDLTSAGPATLIADAFACLVQPGDRLIRVLGRPRPGAEVVEVVLDQRPLKVAVRAYGWRIFWLSLTIGSVTALIVYLLVKRLLVRPMRRVVDSMAAFRADPEGAAIIRPKSGVREVAEAEGALAEMQTQVRAALRERARLAALGEAVSKIAHDLRNMLATAQLVAGGVELSRDPGARRIGPTLVSALDRAVALCERTLRYGRAEEAPPEPRPVALTALVDEVRDAVFPDRAAAAGRAGRVDFLNAVPRDLEAVADPEHLFRILSNLVRNARQAIEASGAPGSVAVAARAAHEEVEIDVIDDGPGLSSRAVENLFRPFSGGARQGGAGLGLAIAHELTLMQGGRLELARSTAEGAVFRLTLPGARGALASQAATPAKLREARARPDAAAQVAGATASRQRL